MNEYNGKSERELRALLEDCTNFQERRKIRAAIKELHRPPGDDNKTRTPNHLHLHPHSASNGIDSAPVTSSNMASTSLSTRPVAMGFDFHGNRRGTMPVLPTFKLTPGDSIVADPATSPLFAVADSSRSTDRGSYSGGRRGSGDSLSRLGSSRFVSASVFDKHDSAQNGVLPDSPPSRLTNKRHSLGVIGGTSLLSSSGSVSGLGHSAFGSSSGLHGIGHSTSSTSSVFSPLENGQQSPLFQYKEQKSPAHEPPKRINIRRSSHVFLSDGERHSPAPLLSPSRRGSYNYDHENDSVFDGEDHAKRRGSSGGLSFGGTSTGLSSPVPSTAGRFGSAVESPATTNAFSSRLSFLTPSTTTVSTSTTPHANAAYTPVLTATRLGSRSDRQTPASSATPALFPSSTTTTATSSMPTNNATMTAGSRQTSAGERDPGVGLPESVLAAINACTDEEELLDMLCRADDFKERCKIRARMKELKDAREAGRTIDGGQLQTSAATTTTTTTPSSTSFGHNDHRSLSATLTSSFSSSPSAAAKVPPASTSFSSSFRTPSPSLTTSANQATHWAKADLPSQAERPSGATERDEIRGTGQSGTVSDPSTRLLRDTDGSASTGRKTPGPGGGSVGGGDVVTTTATTVGGGESSSKEKEYDHIYDIEQLRQLLNGTVDFEEKRKIRNAMRLVRRNSELEKAKTDIAPVRPRVGSFGNKDLSRSRGSSFGNKDLSRSRGSSFSAPGEKAHRTSSPLRALPSDSPAAVSKETSAASIESSGNRRPSSRPGSARVEDRVGTRSPTVSHTKRESSEKSWEDSLRGPNRSPLIFKRPERASPVQSPRKAAVSAQDRVSDRTEAVRSFSPSVTRTEEKGLSSDAGNVERKSAFVPVIKSTPGSPEHLRSFVVKAVPADTKDFGQTVDGESAFQSAGQEQDKRPQSPAQSLHSRVRRPRSPSESIANKVVRAKSPDSPSEHIQRSPSISQNTRPESPRVTRPQSPAQPVANQVHRSASPLQTADGQDRRPPSPGGQLKRPSSPAQFKRPPSPGTPIRRPSSPFLSEGKLHSKEPSPGPSQPVVAVHVKRPSSPFLSGGGAFLPDKRPESPFQLQGSKQARRPPSPFKVIGVHQNKEEPVKPSVTSSAEPPRTQQDKRPPSPAQVLNSQQDKRPPSPAQVPNSQQDKRPPSPSQVLNSQQDKRPPSPSQVPNSQQDKRPPSPSQVLNSQQDKRPPSPAQVPNSQQDKRPPSPSQVPNRQQDKRPPSPLQAPSSKPDTRTETPTLQPSGQLDKRPHSPAQPVNSERDKPAIGSAQEKTYSEIPKAEESRLKQQESTRKPVKGERGYKTGVLTEFSALKTPPVVKTLTAAEASESGVTQTEKKTSESSTRTSASADRQKGTSLSRKESFDQDLVDQVKARLKSRSESLSSEEKIPASIRASKRSSLASTSEVSDSESKAALPAKDALTTEVLSEETVKVPSKASEPKYKELRALVRTSGLEKKPVEEELKPSRPPDTPASAPEKPTTSQEKQGTAITRPDQPTPLLSDFQKLDKGLKPSASKTLVSSLASKFVSEDKDEPPFSTSLRRAESVRVVGRATTPDKSQKSLLPRRSESFGSHDSPRKPLAEKRQTETPSTSGKQTAATASTPTKQTETVSTQLKQTETAPTSPKQVAEVAPTPLKQLERQRPGKTSEVSLIPVRKHSLPASADKKASVQKSSASESPSQLPVWSRRASTGVLEGSKTSKDDTKKMTSLLSSSTTAMSSQNPAKGSDMESAFSALLDDMETFSASEGTSSDLDLSDGDEAPPTVSPSKGGITVTDGIQQKGLTDASLAPVAEVMEEKAADGVSAGESGVSRDTVDGREVLMINKEDSGIGMGTGDLDDAGASAPQLKTETALSGESKKDVATTSVPVQQHDGTDKSATTAEPSQETASEDETSPPPPPLTNPPSASSPTSDPDMTSSAFLVLKPHIDAVVKSQGNKADSQRTVTLVEDDDGTVTFRKISRGEQQNRIVTIKSKKRRTPSNADEEMRDTIVETNFHSPGGALIKERDVVSTKRKITQRGSNYFQRTTQYTRRVRDREGSETIEHDVIVESDNTSASDGHQWGDKTVTKVTLEQASGALPQALEDLGNLPQIEATKKTQPAVTMGRMDMSKASSGYGSVSGSEEEDKEGTTAENKPAKALGAPEIIGPLKDVSISEGQVALLECALIGQPTPEVTWYRGGKEVDANDERYVTNFDSATGKATLAIRDVVLKDAAEYSCVCRNQHGEAAAKSTVSVKQKPESAPVFLEPLHDLTVVEDHSVTLQCVVQFAASVAWYKDGIIQRHSSDFRQTFDGRVARLEIGEVFLDDVGVFSCVARNELGEERTSCRLHVTACTSETTVVPMFLTKLPNKTITDGDSLLLECDVIGSPEPSIDWLRDGRPLTCTTLSFSTSYDGRLARLQVDEMTLSDEGVFECVAENSAGRVSMDAKVSVHVKNKPPSFVSSLQDVTVDAGKNITLKCDVAGTPSPSVFWRRNGLIVADTPEFIQSHLNGCARLEIIGVKEKHGGQYECVAKNEAGDAVCSCKVTVNVPKSTLPEQAPPQRQQEETPPPPVVTRRTFKKLSEPHASDVISAVLRSAEKKTGVQRAQSFSPRSATVRDTPSPIRAFSVVHGEARTLEEERETITVPKPQSPAGDVLRKNGADVSETKKDISGTSRKDISQVSRVDVNVGNGTETPKIEAPVARYTVQWANPDGTVTPDGGSKLSTSDFSVKVDVGVKADIGVKKDTLHRDFSLSSSSSSATNTSTAGFSPLAPSTQLSGGRHGAKAATDENSNIDSNRKISAPPVSRFETDSPDSKISDAAKPVSAKGTSESPRSLVSQLRDKFSKGEDTGDKSGSGIRRWHSMPLKQERPTVIKRERPSQVTSHSPLTVTSDTMSASYDHINDEEELHKLMNATENFEERKKIRSRLREIRDAQRAEMEERRKQREKEAEDLVKKKFERAEEEKRRKMEAYKAQKPTCERDTEYHSATQKLIEDKKKLADEEKAKKLEAYKTISSTAGAASVKTTTTTSTARGPDGSTTVTKKTETTVKQVQGFGGVQYGAPEDTAEGEEEKTSNNTDEHKNIKEEEDAGKSNDTQANAPEKAATPTAENEKPESSNAHAEAAAAATTEATESPKGNVNVEETAGEEKSGEPEKQDSTGEEKCRGTSAKDEAPKQDGEKAKAAGDAAKKEATGTAAATKKSASAQLNTRAMRDQLASASGPGTSGSISVKTESWSSRDGVVRKTQKTESWGAKPQGARGAMAAFKQMDANNPAPKPNENDGGLVTATMVKRAATTMRKNAVAIKQEILNFVTSNTAGYENVEVTNFSSSWNNGLAFCALIHHFFPDAFDYSKLDAKQRRYNFQLAFDTAEKLADIAPLLDVEDMVKMKNPDWKCVFTYVQSIYRHLRDHENNKAKAEA